MDRNSNRFKTLSESDSEFGSDLEDPDPTFSDGRGFGYGKQKEPILNPHARASAPYSSSKYHTVAPVSAKAIPKNKRAGREIADAPTPKRTPINNVGETGVLENQVFVKKDRKPKENEDNIDRDESPLQHYDDPRDPRNVQNNQYVQNNLHREGDSTMNVDHLGDVTKEYNRTDNNTYNIDNREFAVNNETRKEYNQYVKDQRQVIYNMNLESREVEIKIADLKKELKNDLSNQARQNIMEKLEA